MFYMWVGLILLLILLAGWLADTKPKVDNHLNWHPAQVTQPPIGVPVLCVGYLDPHPFVACFVQRDHFDCWTYLSEYEDCARDIHQRDLHSSLMVDYWTYMPGWEKSRRSAYQLRYRVRREREGIQ